jgi:hypothetical protein
MVDYKDLKSQVKTRRDFNNLMNKYNRYLKDNAEEIQKNDRGAVATNWQIKEFNIAQRAENTRRKHMREKLGEKEVTIGGKGTGVKRKEMGSIKENAVKESKKSFKGMRSQEDWEKAFKLMDKRMNSTYYEDAQRRMLENYIKGLIQEGYSDELLKLMNTIPLDIFEEIIDTDEFATFGFIYDPIELSMKQDRLIELWSQHSDENTNNGVNYEALIKGVE